MKNPDVKFDLPDNLADRAASFGESSYGVSLVTLVLKDGTQIPHVHVAGGQNVIKANQLEDDARLSKLGPSDILDVFPESSASMLVASREKVAW
jgi:hypothetical protein